MMIVLVVVAAVIWDTQAAPTVSTDELQRLRLIAETQVLSSLQEIIALEKYTVSTHLYTNNM